MTDGSQNRLSLSVDAISAVLSVSRETFHEVDAAKRGREDCLDRVEAHYGTSPDSLRRALPAATGQPVRLLDLLRGALSPVLESARQARVMVIAQSYPDIEPLTPPLQKILYEESLAPEMAFGISHAGSLGFSEGLESLSWILRDREQAVLMTGEMLPFQHQRRPGPHGPALANAAIAFSLRAGPGPLCWLGNRTDFLETAQPENWESLCESITAEQGPLDFHLVQQTLAASQAKAPPNDRPFGDFDFMAADLGLSLAHLLRKGVVTPGARIGLTGWDGEERLTTSFWRFESLPATFWVEV